MKYLLLLLLPSSAQAGRVVSETVPTTNAVVVIDTTAKHLDLSTSSYSGTTANVALFTSSNVVISSGFPDAVVIYSSGSARFRRIDWLDGSISTSANAGNISLAGGTSSSSTYTGSAVFQSTVNVTGGLIYGPSGATALTGNNANAGFWMKSIDGTTLSSGCVVVYAMNTAAGAGTNPGTLVFSSTNTTVNPVAIGILGDASCAPGQFCYVITHGLAFVQTASGAAIFNMATTSGVGRCLAGVAGGQGTSEFGVFLSITSGANQGAWVMLNGH